MLHVAQADFTTAEAAFVLREPVWVVRKALDKGPVRPVLRRKTGANVRVIGLTDLFYLYASQQLKDELTPKAREQLYVELKSGLEENIEEVRLGHIRIFISHFMREVEDRTKALVDLASGVEFSNDGEPLLKGTQIEVHRIAALLDGGLSIDDVLADYPSLDRQAVETAAAYALAHPKSGRPYPRNTAKRALRDAGMDALDEVLGDATG